MNSMTGYGEAADENPSYRVTVVLRAVNQRFLDLQVRLSEAHLQREREVEQMLRSRLTRGRVEARLTIEPLGGDSRRLRVDRELAAQLARELGDLAEGPMRIGDLLRAPGVVQVESEPLEWTKGDDRLLATTVGDALEQLLAARRSEGERLHRMLDERLAALRQRLAELEERLPLARDHARRELATRLADLVGEAGLDPGRLEQEAAILVERADVREELDRLAAHLDHFDELMAAEGAVGKRLDFLSQEILRELNTVASKCRDTEMTRAVVHGKLLCEQLREQIQNVE